MAYKIPAISAINQINFVRTAISGDYVVLATDELVVQTNPNGPFTFILPDPSTVPVGKVYVFKDETGNASVHVLDIEVGNPGGSEKIDDVYIYVINTNYGKVSIYNAGTTWFTW